MDMRRIRSERFPTERVLPVVWGPRTHARAAAPLTGVGTGVGGVAALGCSSDTDPIKVHIWPQEGLNLVPASCERRLGTGERLRGNSRGCIEHSPGLSFELNGKYFLAVQRFPVHCFLDGHQELRIYGCRVSLF